MIEITRRQARVVRSMIRRALGLSPKHGEHPVRITVNKCVGAIQSQRNGVAVEYRFDSDLPLESIVVPLSIFVDCEAARDDPVSFSKQADDTVLVEWQDKGVPILRTASQFEFDDKLPSPPEFRHELPDEFLPAMADAMATTDREASRYSIDCVQLCGKTGRILATDSRKAIVVSGFSFPWRDEVLLPWNRVFGLKELNAHGSIQIGRDDKKLSVSTGPWTLHFALETERRFPRIDDCIPKPGCEKTTLTITDDDAEFALAAFKNLPKSDLDNSVTLELSTTVRIRAKGDGPPTELVLSNSRSRGEPNWFVSDRDILRHGLQLGFRQFRIVAPNKVVVSEVGSRTFLFMPIELPEPLTTASNAVRLMSPVQGDANPPTPTSTPTRSSNDTMAKKRPTRNGQDVSNSSDTTNGSSISNGIDLLIERAENLKVSLRKTQAAVSDLISGLKQHRQQSRRLRSAVLSLKQLQAIDA